MLYSSKPQLPAQWDLFQPEETDTVSQFVKEWCGHKGPSHLIHSQQVYLTPCMLDLLYKKHGIRPYTIYQYPLDAVLIPAGCIHQVRLIDMREKCCSLPSHNQVVNLSSGIKITVDFVSPWSIPQIQALEEGQCQHCIMKVKTCYSYTTCYGISISRSSNHLSVFSQSPLQLPHNLHRLTTQQLRSPVLGFTNLKIKPNVIWDLICSSLMSDVSNALLLLASPRGGSKWEQSCIMCESY